MLFNENEWMGCSKFVDRFVFFDKFNIDRGDASRRLYSNNITNID